MRQFTIALFVGYSFMLFACNREDNNLPRYNLFKTNEKIVVDGNLNESSWQKADLIPFKLNDTGGSIDNPALLTIGKGCYDNENMYFAFQCNDPDIWCNYTQRDEYLWNEEVVELFIDTDDNPENYIEIEISPSNVLFDSFIVNPQKIDFKETAKFNLKGIKTAVKVDGTLNNRDDLDKNWVVEMSIPFSDMIGKVTPEDVIKHKWKIDFFRVNRDKGKEDGKYAWSPTLGRFHTPSKFGILRFN